MDASGTDRVNSVPATLRWAVWLLYGEAAAVAGVTAWLIYSDFTGRPAAVSVAIGLTVFAAAAAASLAALGRALSRRRAAARGPAIVLQLMLVVTGATLLQGDLDLLGGGLIALGVSVGVLIVSPPTTRALGLD